MTSAHSMLTPGSVWERKTKKGSTYTTVLAVSNEGLPEETLELFPQQVVFITEKYKILTQPIDVYLKTREYYGIDEQAEVLVKQLTTEPQPEPEEDDLDIDSIDLSGEDSDGEEDDSEENNQAEVPEPEAQQIQGQVLQLNAVALPVLDVGPHPYASILTNAFVAYSEAPYFTGDTLHALSFKLSEELTLKKISEAFLIADPNAIQNFAVTYEDTRILVAIDGYASCNMQINSSGRLGTVFLTSSGDFRAEELTESTPTVIFAETPVVETQVQQSSPSVTVVNV